MKISLIITLKKDVLDPQGKVIHQTLDGMGFENINEVRQGKYFEIDINESDKIKAETKRSRGRQPMNWGETIEKDLKEKGLQPQDALDRKLWKALIREPDPKECADPGRPG